MTDAFLSRVAALGQFRVDDPAAPTLSRAVAKLTRGVFASPSRSVGLLDETRLFQAIRERVR